MQNNITLLANLEEVEQWVLSWGIHKAKAHSYREDRKIRDRKIGERNLLPWSVLSRQ